MFAGLIAKGLQEAGGVYADLLVEEETLNEKEIGYRTEKGLCCFKKNQNIL